MTLTTAITRVCQAWSGKIKTLYLADKADVTSFTLTGGIYTAVTMASGKVFKDYQFFEDANAEFKEEPTRNETSGSIMNTQTIDVVFRGKSNALRVSLQEILDSSTCGMIAIVEDFNDQKWVVGYNEKCKKALKMSTMPSTIGGELDALVGSTLTLMVKIPAELARTFTATVPV